MSTSTATTEQILDAVPLSADDLAAIKLTDTYSLHTGPDLLVGNGSILRIYTQATNTGKGQVFSARQQILFPIVDLLPGQRAREIIIGASAHGYGSRSQSIGGWQWPNRYAAIVEPTPKCYFSGYARDEWATIARTLRVGSVLSVMWTADNNTLIAEEAGLHLDAVRLLATTGKHKDVWNVGTETCRDNSARMIKRGR